MFNTDSRLEVIEKELLILRNDREAREHEVDRLRARVANLEGTSYNFERKSKEFLYKIQDENKNTENFVKDLCLDFHDKLHSLYTKVEDNFTLLNTKLSKKK